MAEFRSFLSILVFVISFGQGSLVLAQNGRQSVLVLDQSVPGWPFSQRFISQFRSSLSASDPSVTVYAEFLDLGRFAGADYERTLTQFLYDKYRRRQVNAVVAVGSGAYELFARMRPRFLPDVPVVVASFEAGAPQFWRPDNTAVISVPLRFANVVRSARLLVPNLRHLVLVGDPFSRQPFRRHYVAEIKQFGDLDFIDLTGLSLQDVKARVADLPEDTAIFYSVIYTDAAGQQYDFVEALGTISKAANRPVVVDAEVNIGAGSVGGYVVSAHDVARAAARLTSRALVQEEAKSISSSVADLATPIFDARQLRRWGIPVSAMPEGSELRYDEQSPWDVYRWQIIAAAAIFILQGAGLVWLMVERRRRHAAQLEAHQRTIESARMNRALVASTLSASLAHELNQPLSAIMHNAEAAKINLDSESPDLHELKQMINDVLRDDQRAAEIIRRVRRLLENREPVAEQIELGVVLEEAAQILEPDALKRGVSLIIDPTTSGLRCWADPVQLRQVIINLVVNAMDAMSASERSRRVDISARFSGASDVQISVADTGSGIPDGHAQKIFEPMFSTKPDGTGLGLSIVVGIIESAGGRIWAENREDGGAAFHFTLKRAA